MIWLYGRGEVSITIVSCTPRWGGARERGALNVGEPPGGGGELGIGRRPERRSQRRRRLVGQVLAGPLTRAPEPARHLLCTTGHHRGQALRPAIAFGGRGGGTVLLRDLRTDRRH